jgi:hypothetical protein
MQPRTPAGISNQDTWNKSVKQAMNANLSPGNAVTYAATDNTPLTYSQDNMSGIIIRVGSTANPNVLPYFWTGSGTDTTITHNLGKIPYGFIVIASYLPCNIYWGSITATTSQITLRTNAPTTDTTIWILA